MGNIFITAVLYGMTSSIILKQRAFFIKKLLLVLHLRAKHWGQEFIFVIKIKLRQLMGI